MKRGKLIVISGPSGVGKTSIINRLLLQVKGLKLSISATTRKKRVSEEESKSYYFLTKEVFEAKIKDDSFIEYEKIWGHYYGTVRSVVESMRNKGLSVLFDIDVNGALALKKAYKSDALLIFVKTPTIDDLKERLLSRKTESGYDIETRLSRVRYEISKSSHFDYRVINNRLEEVVEEVSGFVLKFLQV